MKLATFLFFAGIYFLVQPTGGLLKVVLLTFMSFWWLCDIIRTGSAPVYAYDFRVAHDLPHWVYTLITTVFFLALSFLVAIESAMTHRKQKREDMMVLKDAEESRNWKKEDFDGPRFRNSGSRSFDGRPHVPA